MVIDSFLGIRNTSSKRDIPGNSLQDATDVDITDAGAILARSGYIQSSALSISSAYTTRAGSTYVVSSGRLYRVNAGLDLIDLGPTTATHFCDYDDFLFTNTGQQIYRDEVVDIHVPAPNPPDIVITGGSRETGRYNIVTTLTNANGLESGTSPVVTVELSSPGDILITPHEPIGYRANVYMTEADGTVYFNLYTGHRIDPYFFNENHFPPNATVIEYHESRLYVAVPFGEYTTVYYSEPLMYHLFGADDQYFIVPGTVLGMASTAQGLVVATDQNIYAYQDDALSQPLAAYGAVPGRPMLKLPTGQVLIHTVRGVCSALPLTEITQHKVSLPMGTQCSTALMFSKGIERYIALHNGLGEPFNAAF